jgi:hypothetical protein
MNEYALEWLEGDALASIQGNEFRWIFNFASGGSLILECPWRVLESGKIRISSADHNQRYGLPAPVNAAVEAAEVLWSLIVKSVTVAQKSGDIKLIFGSDLEFQVVPFSSGYEAWQSVSPRGFQVIAQGGQQLVGFRPNPA